MISGSEKSLGNRVSPTATCELFHKLFHNDFVQDQRLFSFSDMSQTCSDLNLSGHQWSGRWRSRLNLKHILIVIRAGAPLRSHRSICRSQPIRFLAVWIQPMRGQHRGHVTDQSPGHVILSTNERRGGQLPRGPTETAGY